MATSTIKYEGWEEISVGKTVNTGTDVTLKAYKKGKMRRLKITDAYRAANTSAGSDVLNCTITGLDGTIDGYWNVPSNYGANMLVWGIYNEGVSSKLNVRVLVGSISANTKLNNNIIFMVE